MTPASMTMPLVTGRLGLFAVPHNMHDDTEPVVSALYFETVQACLLLREGARVKLVMPADAALHDAFLFRCRRSTFDMLRERVASEITLHGESDGPCSRETDGITFTANNNPRCGERWFASPTFLSHVSPGVNIYEVHVTHHVAFEALVALIEKSRLSKRAMRLFHPMEKQLVDCAVQWADALHADRAPSFLESARLISPGHAKNVAFVPRRGTGETVNPFAILSTGSGGQLLKIIQPKVYMPSECDVVLHLSSPSSSSSAAAAASPGERKTRRDTDDAILAADKKQQRVTSFFAPRADKPRNNEAVVTRLVGPSA